MAYEAALTALADPTRRQVFEQLRGGPRAVGEIAQDMPVSRPAVSQHLKVLKLAGLVNDRADGTRRVYYIDPAGLGEIRKWFDQFWDEALVAFQAEVERASAAGAAKPKSRQDEPNNKRGARSQKRTGQRRTRARV